VSEYSRADKPTARKSIGSAAVILMLGNLVGSVLGFARQSIIAGTVGGNYKTDAFFASLLVPQMFYDLTVGAAISAALIPTFTEVIEHHGIDRLGRVVGSVSLLATGILVGLVAVLVLGAGPLMHAILWGFHQHLHPVAVDLTVRLVRILVPSLLFLGLAAIMLSGLYSLRKFVVPGFAPSSYHLGIIVGALVLYPRLGIIGLPIGAVLGSAVQLLVQVVAFVRAVPEYRPRFALDPFVRRIGRLYAPVALGLLVSIAGQIIDLDFKWSLGEGAVTAMQLATTLVQFPIGIAVAALSFAILPSISADAAANDLDLFRQRLRLGFRLILFLTVPAAIAYLVLGMPIVSLLFQHHHFSAAESDRTVSALMGYAPQIPLVGIDQLLIVAFYARKNTITPMLVGIVGVCSYVLFASLLIQRFHILGLAIANTLQNSLHAVILLALLSLSLGQVFDREAGWSILRTCVAGAIMALAVLAVLHALGGDSTSSRVSAQLLRVFVPGVCAVITYLVAHVCMRSKDVGLFWATARRRGV